MTTTRKRLVLIWCLLFIGAALVIGRHLSSRRKESGEGTIKEKGKYRIGEISIDTLGKGRIEFTGTISKAEGRVQFLIYLKGYKWLKEESAIVSEARLNDLQQAIALLDWRLWDELWHGKAEDRGQKSEDRGPRKDASRPRGRQKTENRKLFLFVKWEGEEFVAQQLVMTEEKLEIGDFIFLGSPYFDHIALEAPPGVDCRLCPIFPLEQKALKEGFIRESGRSGYELNSPLFPPRGTKVTIVIRGRDYTER